MCIRAYVLFWMCLCLCAARTALASGTINYIVYNTGSSSCNWLLYSYPAGTSCSSAGAAITGGTLAAGANSGPQSINFCGGGPSTYYVVYGSGTPGACGTVGGSYTTTTACGPETTSQSWYVNGPAPNTCYEVWNVQWTNTTGATYCLTEVYSASGTNAYPGWSVNIPPGGTVNYMATNACGMSLQLQDCRGIGPPVNIGGTQYTNSGPDPTAPIGAPPVTTGPGTPVTPTPPTGSGGTTNLASESDIFQLGNALIAAFGEDTLPLLFMMTNTAGTAQGVNMLTNLQNQGDSLLGSITNLQGQQLRDLSFLTNISSGTGSNVWVENWPTNQLTTEINSSNTVRLETNILNVLSNQFNWSTNPYALGPAFTNSLSGVTNAIASMYGLGTNLGNAVTTNSAEFDETTGVGNAMYDAVAGFGGTVPGTWAVFPLAFGYQFDMKPCLDGTFLDGASVIVEPHLVPHILPRVQRVHPNTSLANSQWIRLFCLWIAVVGVVMLISDDLRDGYIDCCKIPQWGGDVKLLGILHEIPFADAVAATSVKLILFALLILLPTLVVAFWSTGWAVISAFSSHGIDSVHTFVTHPTGTGTVFSVAPPDVWYLLNLLNNVIPLQELFVIACNWVMYVFLRNSIIEYIVSVVKVSQL